MKDPGFVWHRTLADLQSGYHAQFLTADVFWKLIEMKEIGGLKPIACMIAFLTVSQANVSLISSPQNRRCRSLLAVWTAFFADSGNFLFP